MANRVVDPCHFGADPDQRIRGSVPLTLGSGSCFVRLSGWQDANRIREAQKRTDPMDPDPDPQHRYPACPSSLIQPAFSVQQHFKRTITVKCDITAFLSSIYLFPICFIGASVHYAILFIYCLVINRYRYYSIWIELFTVQRRCNTSVRVLISGVPCSGLGRSLGDLLARPPLLPVRSWPHICSEVTGVQGSDFQFRQFHKRQSCPSNCATL